MRPPPDPISSKRKPRLKPGAGTSEPHGPYPGPTEGGILGDVNVQGKHPRTGDYWDPDKTWVVPRKPKRGRRKPPYQDPQGSGPRLI